MPFTAAEISRAGRMGLDYYLRRNWDPVSKLRIARIKLQRRSPMGFDPLELPVRHAPASGRSALRLAAAKADVRDVGSLGHDVPVFHERGGLDCERSRALVAGLLHECRMEGRPIRGPAPLEWEVSVLRLEAYANGAPACRPRKAQKPVSSPRTRPRQPAGPVRGLQPGEAGMGRDRLAVAAQFTASKGGPDDGDMVSINGDVYVVNLVKTKTFKAIDRSPIDWWGAHADEPMDPSPCG